jgi:hypothetical protein
MRKLVFYSDQGHKNNARVDAKLLSLLRKPSVKVGYISIGWR